MNEHAVVIGASIAGLAAAEAVARQFARVTLLERDELPEQAGFAPAESCSSRSSR
jgi:flavin-dependent dehydrogenase